jgi:hypothetical protein
VEQSLNDLRLAHPVDVTLENILETLAGKLHICARLPVCEWEARSEGFSGPARMFEELAVNERTQIETLLACLQRHLEIRTVSRRSDPARSVQP